MQDIHKNIAGRLIGGNIAFMCVATISVMLRMYVRVFISKGVGFDDVMILVTLIIFLTYGSFSLRGLHYGTGQHKAVLSPHNYSKAMEMWYFAELLYGTTSTLVRISVSFLLLRVMKTSWHKYIIYISLAISTTIGYMLLALVVFQCQPISFFWSYDKNPMVGHCVDPHIISALMYTHGIAAAINDLILGLLPLALVKNLNMGIRAKIGAGLLLCCANFAGVASLVRLAWVKQLASYDDFLFNTLGVALWSTIEVGVGISACALVTTRPLFRNIILPETITRIIGKTNQASKASQTREGMSNNYSNAAMLQKSRSLNNPINQLMSVDEEEIRGEKQISNELLVNTEV